ncbi:MAG TPA: YihY/virulence factor BrkB family protein [Rudaea sp.]|nr:YihY/virulence factor BrkB family protein [Rudaea sp.]
MRKPLRSFWRLTRTAALGFVEDDALTLSAALTFSTLLSFAPLLILALSVTSALGWSAQDAILDQLGALAGESARSAAQSVLESATQRPAAGGIAATFGLIVAFVGATTVFAQLQTSLNDIWRVKKAAASGNALWSWLRRRLLSVGLLTAVGFVLIVSLLVSAVLGTLFPHEELVGELVNQALSFVVFAVLFAALFRYLPQVRLGWRRALAGGSVTAALFLVGKVLIGIYIAHGAVGTAYGAASSLVVLLVWVYYSSAIFLFGAELVKAWLLSRGISLDTLAGASVRKSR